MITGDGVPPEQQNIRYEIAIRRRPAVGHQPRRTRQAPVTCLKVALSCGVAQIGMRIAKHHSGADHVLLMLRPGEEFAAGIDQLEQLAPALVAIG